MPSAGVVESTACRSAYSMMLPVSATITCSTPVDAPGSGTLFFARSRPHHHGAAMSITTLLCISPQAASIFHPVPRVDGRTERFGTTMLWRVTVQCGQRKSPLAMESINDRYCRSRRRDALARNVTSRAGFDAYVLRKDFLSGVHFGPNNSTITRETTTLHLIFGPCLADVRLQGRRAAFVRAES